MNGLYIHIPFCLKKCSYCDFVSYENCLAEGEQYVNALLLEMEQYRGAEVNTVYIGGGTPTVLPPHLLIRILLGVTENFVIAPQTEITVEANPGTCDGAYFQKLRQAGVNRISLGVQSFVDDELKLLGRIHSAEEAKKAVNSAKEAGIFNVSLDLMFSLPNQTRESFLYSIQEAIALDPAHISSYSLMVCENTPLEQAVSQGKLTLPDEDEDRALYTLLVETLQQAGYGRYEISNFAKPGKEACHNTKYWTRDPYIGLGVAAHSFWQNRRFENPSSFSDYYAVCRGEKERAGEEITEKDAMAEFMFLGLRMTEQGISKEGFLQCFGVCIEAIYGKQIEKLCKLDLLECLGDTIRLTKRGVDVSNGVFCEFV